MPSTFPERLKELRNKKDLTQESLGKLFGLTKVAISGYENGQRKPDYDLLIKIANYFNVSVDYLLGTTDNPKPIDKIVNTALSDDPELLSFWNELKEREDLQLLFKQTKDLSPDAVKRIIRIIKAIEVEEALED